MVLLGLCFTHFAWALEVKQNEKTVPFALINSWIAPANDEVSYEKLTNFVSEVSRHSHDDSKSTLDIKVAVNEPLTLHIVIATPMWFTAPTQLPQIELQSVISSQRHLSSNNANRTLDGQAWSYQSWEIPLFTTSVGDYNIPKMSVTTQVSTQDGEKKDVTLWTPAMRLLSDYPSPSLNKKTTWFAAPSAQLTEQWQVSNDELRVGDSITRSVKLTAEDTLAVMLPNLILSDSNDAYQSYLSPINKQDEIERGDRTATQIEKSTYVLQNGGRIEFPAITVKWWNTDTHKLELLSLPKKAFIVKHTLKSWFAYYGWMLALGLTVVLCFAYGLHWLKSYYRTHPWPSSVYLMVAMRQNNWPQCRVLLYRRLQLKTGCLSFSEYRQDKVWQQRVTCLQSDLVNAKSIIWIWINIRINKPENRLYRALPALNTIKLNQNKR